jgi:phosphoglucosamine mutase
MGRMSATGTSLADLTSVVQRLPQVLINVPVTDRLAVAENMDVAEAVNAVEAELGDSGRVLLRPSGTEQLVRVMVEAPTQAQADEVAARLAEIVSKVG